ncbi:MAG: hypothetical protein CVU57_02035 [Deltaproteobacteria bacterium HGW-Deltaproteobacteria-15]|nr:MAG: hypothetical protein CVU57_02035 [Deltaproteobacteria bacterium HGW-Deltaproteobacteria-15]
MKDFSLRIYGELLEVIKRTGCPVFPVREHLSHGQGHNPAVFILRHDVDRRPGRALRMADVESLHGIRATYYFRMLPGVFVSSIVKRIESLGHEIGYHYEVLDKAKGELALAERIFIQELEEMRSIADVKTAAMHGNPFSTRDNREFWTHHQPAEFGLVGEAYVSFKEKDIVYLTDTGRGWNRARFNVRDRLPYECGAFMPPFRSTWDLMEALRERRFGKVYLQIHPNRWTSNSYQWYSQRAEDSCLNALKWVLLQIRKGRSGR